MKTQLLSYFASQHNSTDEVMVVGSPFPQRLKRLSLNTILSGIHQHHAPGSHGRSDMRVNGSQHGRNYSVNVPLKTQ